MRIIKRVLFLCSIIVLIAETALAIDVKNVIAENALLRSELQLAKKADIYFVFNLAEKKIQFKAMGVVLKELLIENTKLWGSPIKSEPLKLIKKTAILKPRRAKIKPGQADEKDTFELDALEVKDMPARYRLTLEDNVWLYVRPRPDTVSSKIFHEVSMLKAYIIRPVLSFWNALWGETFTEMDVTVDERDARALYWSFAEGLSCIIYEPLGNNPEYTGKPVGRRGDSHKNNETK